MASGDKSIKVITYILIAALLVIIGYIVLNEKVTPGTYSFINEKGSEFEIKQVWDGKYVTYDINIEINKVDDEGNLVDKQIAKINLRTEPEEVKDTLIIGNPKNAIFSKEVVWNVINPEQNLTGETTLASMEIAKIIGNGNLFNTPVHGGTITKIEDNELPVRNCQTVNSSDAVIWLKLGQTNKIEESNGCIILEATSQDNLIKLADALVLYLLGIIP